MTLLYLDKHAALSLADGARGWWFPKLNVTTDRAEIKIRFGQIFALFDRFQGQLIELDPGATWQASPKMGFRKRPLLELRHFSVDSLPFFNLD